MGRGHREELRHGERTQRGVEAWEEDTERSEAWGEDTERS